MTLIKQNFTHNFGYIKIKPTINNIFITLTDIKGNVLLSKHAGMLEFKGARKRTPYVASQVLRSLVNDIYKLEIIIGGFIVQIDGFIRNSTVNSIIRYFSTLKIKNVFYLEYLTINSHNGLRKKKKRRL